MTEKKVKTTGLWHLLPGELTQRWRDVVRIRFGDKIADASSISYSRGWYYVRLARLFGDGSIGLGGSQALVLRRSKVIDEILFHERMTRQRKTVGLHEDRHGANKTVRTIQLSKGRRPAESTYEVIKRKGS